MLADGKFFRQTVSRAVQKLKTDELLYKLIPGANHLRNDKTHPLIRCCWLLIILLSLNLFAYQAYLRICYYFTYPVAIDVHLVTDVRHKSEFYPEFTVCSQDTHEIKKLTVNIEEDYGLVEYYSLVWSNILTYLVEKNVDLMYLWNATDLVQGLIKARLLHSEHGFVRNVTGAPTYTIFGLCTVFPLSKYRTTKKLELNIRHVNEYRPSRSVMGNVRSHVQPWVTIYNWMMSPGTVGNIYFDIKKYSYLNKTGLTCSKNNNYDNCVKKCLIQMYRNNSTCRFPFVPSSVNLPICSLNYTSNGSNGMYELYKKAVMIYTEQNFRKECGCVDTCERLIFDAKVKILSVKEPETSILINLEPQVTELSERYIYDTISLLCDIGGNLGLFLDLYLLSIFELIYLICWVKSWKIKKDRDKDFIYRKIHRCFKIIIGSRNEEDNSIIGLQCIMKEKTSRFKKILWTSILLAALLMTGIQIYVLVNHYLTFPMSHTVTVIENEIMHYPSIIMCDPKKDYFFARKKAAVDYGLVGKKLCEIPLINIINSTQDKNLWKHKKQSGQSIAVMQDPGTFMVDFTELGKRTYFNLTFDANMSDIYTPFGVCVQFDVESQTHDVNGLFGTLYKKIADPKCEIGVIKMFINLPDTPDFVKFKQYVDVPVTGRIAVRFTVQQINRQNHPKMPCMDLELANQCHRNCIHKLLIDHVNCTFPFMDDLLNLSSCFNINTTNKIADSATAYANYMKIVTHTDPIRDCGCHRKCTDIFYDVQIYCEPIYGANAVMIFQFKHNIINNYNEEYNYPLGKLLSQIGACVGLTLGISILSIFNITSFRLNTGCKNSQ